MGLVQAAHDWYLAEAPADLLLMPILAQDSSGDIPDADDVARADARLGISVPVMGDHQGEWLLTWGASNGASAHSYALLDADGRLLWRRYDGGSTSVDEIRAVIASELE